MECIKIPKLALSYKAKMIKFKFMAEERKKYDKESKLTVVELSLLRGKVKEVAEKYGIDSQMLSSWRFQYKNHREIAFPGNGKKMQTEAEKEISRLQKGLADVRMERDILKKVIRIFSTSDRKNMHL